MGRWFAGFVGRGMRSGAVGVGRWGIVVRSVRRRGGRSIRGSVAGGISRRRRGRRLGCLMRLFEVGRGGSCWCALGRRR